MARIANDPLENDRANNNNKKIKSNKNKPWNDEINNEQKTSSVERNTRKITRWKASERWIDQLLGASGLHPQCIRLASGQWNPYVGARPFLYFIYSFNFFLFYGGGGERRSGKHRRFETPFPLHWAANFWSFELFDVDVPRHRWPILAGF